MRLQSAWRGEEVGDLEGGGRPELPRGGDRVWLIVDSLWPTWRSERLLGDSIRGLALLPERGVGMAS